MSLRSEWAPASDRPALERARAAGRPRSTTTSSVTFTWPCPHLGHLPRDARRSQDPMREAPRLLDGPEDLPFAKLVPDPHQRLELPALLPVQGGVRDPAADEVPGERARTERGRSIPSKTWPRSPGPSSTVSGSPLATTGSPSPSPFGLLVHLDRGEPGADPDDLAQRGPPRRPAPPRRGSPLRGRGPRPWAPRSSRRFLVSSFHRWIFTW